MEKSIAERIIKSKECFKIMIKIAGARFTKDVKANLNDSHNFRPLRFLRIKDFLKQMS
jgi:hypothetical protein